MLRFFLPGLLISCYLKQDLFFKMIPNFILLFHDVSKTELVNHEAVWEAFAKAKKEGKILAHGFSAHTNQVELSKKHNADPFYDVMMLAFNPHSGYNKPNVRDYSWDQETLISELKKASAAGTGIVAMKTCFGGPYCCEGDAEKTFAGAVPQSNKCFPLQG